MKKLHDLTVTASAELQQCWEMGSVINPTTTIRHIVTRLAPVSMRHYLEDYLQDVWAQLTSICEEV